MTVPHFGKRDKNEKPIIERLVGEGASVAQISKPCDLIVAWRGITTLLEVKKRGGKLTRDEAAWWAAPWPGRRAIVHDETEACQACGILPGWTF
jgi:hypothetical protein